jgi:hypothetical protein
MAASMVTVDTAAMSGVSEETGREVKGVAGVGFDGSTLPAPGRSST